MALVEVLYPVTGTAGDYRNIFPSQKRLEFSLRRIDSTITNINSGTDNNVNIQTSSIMSGIKVGDFVSWGSEGYSPRSSRVTVVNSENDIEVDEVFTSSVATNSFINYRRSWYLEIRYISKETLFGEQVANELFDFTSQIPNAVDGSVLANISLPAELLEPDFSISTGLNAGLFTEYKIQYRESYEGNREESWLSPEPDIPIMLVHGSNTVPFNDFTDEDLPKRFIKGYPLLYSYIYSDVNDGGTNRVTFSYVQYNIQQKVISSTELDQFDNANGVYTLYIDTNTLQIDCAFVLVQSVVVGDLGDYDGDQYDGTEYQTTEDGGGFPYVFPLELD